jgi:hypothetical protein
MRKRALIPGVPIGLLRDSKSSLGWPKLFGLFFDEAKQKRVVDAFEKAPRLLNC